MHIALIHNGTRHLDALLLLLNQHTVTVILRDNITSTDFSPYEAVVISGGGFSVENHLDRYAEILTFITTYSGALIGICLGAQLIAAAYGGTLTRLQQRISGATEITLTENQLPKTLTVHEAHIWSITKLPPQFNIISTLDDGLEIFEYSKQRVFGVQFHPELSEKTTQAYFLSKLTTL